MVGADFYEIDFKEEGWFMKYSWDQLIEEKFKNWLTKYLMTHRKARAELFEFDFKDKFWIKKAVESFILNYGWKTKVDLSKQVDESWEQLRHSYYRNKLKLNKAINDLLTTLQDYKKNGNTEENK